LAAGIAHEINTPSQFVGDNIRFLHETFRDLEPLLKLVKVLKNEGSKNTAIKELAGIAEGLDIDFILQEFPSAIEESLEGMKRVTEIVKAMRDFSHPGSGDLKMVDLNKALQSVVTVAKNEWKYVSTVELNLDPELPEVSCLPGEINQVFLNLLVNAAQAIGEKYKEKIDGEKGLISIISRQKENWVEIEFRDTANGIPEEVRNKIFDPFFTTKEVGKGTGQGLAISYDVVVNKHSGKLSFHTIINEGTSFFVQLPIHPPEQEKD